MIIGRNRCIVSLATKNSRYVDGLARLSNSLRDNASGIDFLGFIHEYSVGAPLHTEMPYAFKVHAIQKAIDAGYTQIMWLDVSSYAVAPIHHLFDVIDEQGYWFEGAGCWLGDYTNDETLEYYGIEREYAKQIPMIQSGFMGFDMHSKIGINLFSELTFACDMGLFAGSWSNHRHDQSCMSIGIHRQHATFTHVPKYVQYAGIYDKVLNDKVILKCQGI